MRELRDGPSERLCQLPELRAVHPKQLRPLETAPTSTGRPSKQLRRLRQLRVLATIPPPRTPFGCPGGHSAPKSSSTKCTNFRLPPPPLISFVNPLLKLRPKLQLRASPRAATPCRKAAPAHPRISCRPQRPVPRCARRRGVPKRPVAPLGQERSRANFSARTPGNTGPREILWPKNARAVEVRC